MFFVTRCNSLEQQYVFAFIGDTPSEAYRLYNAFSSSNDDTLYRRSPLER